jgi:dephospho-CoA kinase
VSSDEIVHRLLREDPVVKQAIVDRLGADVLGDDGEIVRSRVAERVFGDAEALEWLEALLHPPVVATYLAWRDDLARLDSPPGVCVTEVPLLYEVGGETQFDKVVAVTAPPDTRAARLGRSVAEREQRLLPEEEKLARADFVFENSGSLEDLDAFASDVIRRLTVQE